MPTIKDIARLSGVSVTTVSGVLNNTVNAASPETRLRVLDTIRKMNYAPSAVARGLSYQRMDTLGVVTDPHRWTSLMTDQHLGGIIDGIISQSSQLRQRTVLYTEPRPNWQSSLPTLADGLCDGLILMVPIVPDEFFEELQTRKVPFVIVGDHRPEPHLSVCDVDNVDAGRQITDYLLGLGHQRIAMLRGESDHQSSVLRACGYREALEAHGLTYDPAIDFCGGYYEASGYEQTRLLLNLPTVSRPTALFCGDDHIAMGALEALHNHGVSVPEEISVVGINDSIEGATGAKPLTTLRQPSREIGSSAVKVLRALITKKEESGQKIILPGMLIVRSTTGVAPR
jgi:DNA-binding LacI/PurR family transcriptional regulator